MDDLYRDYILEHYRRPHNFGVLETPTATFEGANPLCGDRITMQLGIRDGVIKEIAFTGRGCAISQASASLLTDEIMGMSVEKAEAFRADDLLELLGIDISPARLKCAMLSLETLEHALAETPGGGEATSADTAANEPAAEPTTAETGARP
jgi:nitrogen fixation NifU-like protein